MSNRDEYLDFFAQNPKYNGYLNSRSFEELYYWLGEAWQIYDMITICKSKRPAIEAVAKQIELKFGNRTDINVKEDFVKQMIGTAVKHVLSYYGYITTIQKTFLKGSAEWFKSGMHYEFDEAAPVKKKLHWEPKIINLD
ncbi:hypothetical protein [Paenibacillus sp. ATY16]|uniref:hypothetical protein n=1 Tax=Paenibacillus sp. ATY16 TaxID=1759312 RepID=UPI00200D6607|nr:hypothetical protein [Paenibacillus sp. ATY16]MCK9858194.1 hypothetical protein [Paenibacillus sp. ATY16]